MRTNLRRLAAVAVTIPLLALAACGGGQVRGPGNGAATSGAPAGTAAPGSDTFTVSFNLDIITEWDPAVSYSNEIIAMANMYETLTYYDSVAKELQPRLATEWSASDDGLTWTFKLREGVKFHTGRELDATAAKEAIDRTIELKSGAAYIWDAVDSIEATDASTLVFKLKYAAPLDLVSSSAYAAHIYDTQAAGSEDLGKWFEEGHDAGTGPYTAENWQPGAERELTMTAFDDYWGGWKDGQYKKIEFRVTPEVTTAWQLLQSGDVTWVERLSPTLIEQAATTDGVAVSETPSFQNLLALPNTADGPLADPKVRQAVRLAIDTAGLTAALHGAVSEADGIVPPGLLGAGSGFKSTPNLDEAKSLLAEAGYGEGKPLELTLTYAQGDDDQQVFVTLLGSAISQLGGKLNAVPMQWNAQWERAMTGEKQDIFVMYWYPDYADAYSWFANVFRSSEKPYFNLAYLDNADVDKLIDSLPALTATDPAKAEQTYHELQQKLVVDLAAVYPLFVQNYQRAYRASVVGYVDNPAYPNVVFVHQLSHQG
mgnify:CR=1 FL=1